MKVHVVYSKNVFHYKMYADKQMTNRPTDTVTLIYPLSNIFLQGYVDHNHFIDNVISAIGIQFTTVPRPAAYLPVDPPGTALGTPRLQQNISHGHPGGICLLYSNIYLGQAHLCYIRPV